MNARRDAAENAEIVVTIPASLADARSRVVASFTAHKLPVSSQQDQLIEARLPKEDGVLGDYEIIARAVLVPDGTSTTVTLYGEETRTSTVGESPTTTGHGHMRVNPYSRGRAGRVWQQLTEVAAALR